MKHCWNKALALMMASMMTIMAIAIAEVETTTGDGVDGSIALVEIEQEIEPTDIDPVSEEVGDLLVGDLLDLTDQGEPAGEEAPEGADWDGTETWCFFVGDAVFATQEAREGDEIQRPDDPTALEGMVFNGWFLEDGTQLFVGDATIVANPNPQTPDVNVFARFVEAEEPIEETVRRPVEEQATEEPAEEPAEEQASEEPTEGGTGCGGACRGACRGTR